MKVTIKLTKDDIIELIQEKYLTDVIGDNHYNEELSVYEDEIVYSICIDRNIE